MTKIANGGIEAASGGDRLPWGTPELRRIDAGSAEAVDNKSASDDQGPPSNDKS
jgi:hypothetical protein